MLVRLDRASVPQEKPCCEPEERVDGSQRSLGFDRDLDDVQGEVCAAVEEKVRHNAGPSAVIERGVDTGPRKDSGTEQPERLASLKRPNHEEHRCIPDAPRERENERGRARGQYLLQARQSEASPAELFAEHHPELTHSEGREGARNPARARRGRDRPRVGLTSLGSGLSAGPAGARVAEERVGQGGAPGSAAWAWAASTECRFPTLVG